jgi:hypothetical protein
MAEKMIEIYDVVTRLAGFKGRMRLAVRTGISRVRALEIADAPDKVTKFKKEASEIVGRDITELMESEKR